MLRSRRVATIVVITVVAACSADSEATAGFAVADSAGVEVVTTSTPRWGGDRSPWQLTLTAEIGELEGEEPYLFGDVWGVALLPGEGVAVADAHSADIRFYDGDGVFTRRFGGAGDGPGEFRSFGWIDVCGGRLVAYDWQQRRVTTLTLDGELLDTSPFVTPEEGRPPYTERCLPDGSFLAVGWGSREGFPQQEGVHFYTQPADLWILGEGLDEVLTIGTYISSERVFRLRANGGGGSAPHPFSRSVVFAGDDEHIFVGGAERLQIEVRDLQGTLQRILRGPDGELTIDEAFVDRYRSAHLTERDSADRARLADGDFPMPERYPAYSELLVDELGYVWVERFMLPWDESRRWGVFDPEGVFLGHLEVPLDFQLMDVDAGRVAGVAEDELGVPRVRIYELARGAGP